MLVAIPVLLILVAAVTSVVLSRGRGDPSPVLVVSLADGPDVAPDAVGIEAKTRATNGPVNTISAFEEADRAAVAAFVEAEREAEAARVAEEYEQFRLAVVAALLAERTELRGTDQRVAADITRQWGGGKLLMSMPSLGISAAISSVGFERDGRTPATIDLPWAVGWYTFSDYPGSGGNAVFSGHVDWYTGAPAVFGRLRAISAGDPVYMVLADGTPVVYAVERSYWVPADTSDISGIFGATNREAVTFITCGGTWNAVTHDYSHRLIVRAYRVR